MLLLPQYYVRLPEGIAMPMPGKPTSDEDLRFALVPNTAPRTEQLARADLLAEAVVSGGAPRCENKNVQDASS